MYLLIVSIEINNGDYNMNKIAIFVDKSPHGLANARELLSIALEFGLENGFTVFELELQMLDSDFVKEINSKSFVITPIRGKCSITPTGPNSYMMPVLGVKGTFNKTSAAYLSSESIISNFDRKVRTIVLRESSEKEGNNYHISDKNYQGHKSWLQLLPYQFFGSLSITQIEHFHNLLRKFGEYGIYFTPSGGFITFSENDICDPGDQKCEVIYHYKDGRTVRRQEKPDLPVIIKLKSIKELQRLTQLTTIQLTKYTSEILNKLCKNFGHKNYDQTILWLIEYMNKMQKNDADNCISCKRS